MSTSSIPLWRSVHSGRCLHGTKLLQERPEKVEHLRRCPAANMRDLHVVHGLRQTLDTSTCVGNLDSYILFVGTACKQRNFPSQAKSSLFFEPLVSNHGQFLHLSMVYITHLWWLVAIANQLRSVGVQVHSQRRKFPSAVSCTMMVGQRANPEHGFSELN